MSPTPAYRLQGVVHGYEGETVLDIPWLELPASSSIALLGPNGAGKSTLLRILALLERPGEGRVEMFGEPAFPRNRRNGRAVRSATDLRREVTLIHQRPVLFSTSVHGNVAFGLRARGLSRSEIDRRVGEALERVGLGGFERRGSRQLSGGEVQRVVIARALAPATPVMLLDEPTTYLDAAFRPLLVEILRQRVDVEGSTVIVATHDEAFAGQVADESIRLDRGCLRG